MGTILPINSGGTKKYIFKNGEFLSGCNATGSVSIQDGRLKPTAFSGIYLNSSAILSGKTICFKLYGKVGFKDATTTTSFSSLAHGLVTDGVRDVVSFCTNIDLTDNIISYGIINSTESAYFSYTASNGSVSLGTLAFEEIWIEN